MKLVLCLGVFLMAANLDATAPKIVIAHRAASGYLPEHTLAAVALAQAMQADYIEQDIVLTRDGIPVVLHDIHLDTTTDVARRFPDRHRVDGRYYALDFTLAEVKQLRASERIDSQTGRPEFPNRFPLDQASFEVPTLEEELQLIQGLNKTTGRNTGVYPEIKAPAWHRLQGRDVSRITLDVLRRYGYRAKTDPCYVQCFDYAELQRIRRELGFEGKLIQLLADRSSQESETDYDYLRTPRGLDELSRVADGIGPALDQIVVGVCNGVPEFSDLVRNAHDRHLVVHAYTFRADQLPEYAASLEALLRIFLNQADVDGVFADQPDRAAAIVH